MRQICLLALLLFAIVSLPLFSQSDTIKPSPSVVEMRRVWLKGASQSRAGVGSGAGTVGDIDGDGIAEIAIRTGKPWRWSLYRGGNGAPEITSFWTFDSGTARRPLVGDFWGTGRKAVGFERWGDKYGIRISLSIFRTESGQLSDQPVCVWRSVPDGPVTQWPLGLEYRAADLDLDGDDELIVTMHGMGFGNGGDYHGEIWIYAGGPDFQLDTPTVVIRDDLVNGYRFTASVHHLDADPYPDLVTAAQYGDRDYANFYFGRGGLPTDGTRHDRRIEFGHLAWFSLLDCDGDRLTDIAVDGGAGLFLSGTGKSARTRSYDEADVDSYVTSGSGPLHVMNLGYLNSKRFAVLGGWVGFGLIAFSGSERGPDPLWDGFSGGGGGLVDNPFQIAEPIPDCTGDGWDDLLISGPSYNDGNGIALVLAGGPYIPSEDPTVGVYTVDLEGKTNALSLWPNPARDQLNIAWRGNLKRMPRRFEVHDMLGRLVAAGSVPEGDGAAFWQCAGQPGGTYILSVFDKDGHPLASQRFVTR